MLGRHRSSSIPSIDVPYHALPQAPDIEQDINIPSAIDESESTSDDLEDTIGDESTPSNARVDTRIQWIYFMLGAAVLLPWNGTLITPLCVPRVTLYTWVVMITAEPYFISQLRGSSIRSIFGSYLATTFTLSNFLFLAHATITSKKARPCHYACPLFY